MEIREEGLLSAGGILESADAQRIDYRHADLATSLVQTAQVVPRFHDLSNVAVTQGELVRITISARGRTGRSDYKTVDTVDVSVKE